MFRLPLFLKKGVEYSKLNYMPITILTAFNNIFERILALQLNSYFTDKLFHLLSAYRQHYSCGTTLLRIIENFRSALDKHEFASIIGIDLSKTFDSISHDLLLSKLKGYRLSADCCSFISSYLSDRWRVRELKLVTISLLGG